MGFIQTICAATLSTAALLAGTACSGDGGQRGTVPEAAPGLVPSHRPTTAARAGAGTVSGAPAWDPPPGWRSETPSSRMRRAQYRIPAAAGDSEDGECAVFYFGPGQGGDVRSNIDRWANQFTGPGGTPAEAQISEIRAGSITVTRVEARGNYRASPMTMSGGPPPQDKTGYLLLAAIVPAPEANWFFKCTGPEKTMIANRDAFDAMIRSVRSDY